MKSIVHRAIIIAAMCGPVAAQAASPDVLQPIQLGAETVRFDRGDYIVDLPGQHAIAQLHAMPSDHGQLSFVLTVMNTGREAINIDVGNIRVQGTAEAVHVLTRADMERKAANRAGWTKALLIVAGGLSAAAQASQRNHYQAVAATPRSIVAVRGSTACGGCQIAASETVGMTGSQLDRIQYQLDETRRALGEQMLQLTTVYPGQAYGGRIFLSRFKHTPADQMRLLVTVGDETLAFGFRFAAAGTPMPAFRMTTAPQTFAMAMPAYPSPPAFRPATMTQAIATQPVMAVRPAALPVSFTPAAAVAPMTSGVSAVTREKWQRYYASLTSSGVAQGKAHAMADQEFGSID